MAKEYAEVIGVATQKAYDDTTQTGATIVPMAVAAWNAGLGAKASVLGTPGTNNLEIKIQRKKRIKSHLADTNVAKGTQIVNRLNAAEQLDWDTVKTTPGAKRDFLVSVEPGQEDDFTANPADYESGMTQAAMLKIAESEETAISKILGDPAVTKVSLGDLSSGDFETNGKAIFDALAINKINVEQLVDDYVHFAKVGMHVSPYAAAALKAYKGTAFNVDKSQYADEIVPSFSLDNVSFGFVNKNFDKFATEGSGNNEHVIGVVMVSDAYYDSGLDKKTSVLDTKLLDINFQGHSYYGAEMVVDPARIIVLTAQTPTALAAVKKVND